MGVEEGRDGWRTKGGVDFAKIPARRSSLYFVWTQCSFIRRVLGLGAINLCWQPSVILETFSKDNCLKICLRSEWSSWTLTLCKHMFTSQAHSLRILQSANLLFTWLTNHRPSVLWYYWLGHLTNKIVSEMTYNVSSGTLIPTIPYLATKMGGSGEGSEYGNRISGANFLIYNFFRTYMQPVKNNNNNNKNKKKKKIKTRKLSKLTTWQLDDNKSWTQIRHESITQYRVWLIVFHSNY